jgi:hypothetical protein
MRIFVDNEPSIALATKKRSTRGRIKHMDVKYKFVQQMLTDHGIEIRKVSGNENPADLLTKPVSLVSFRSMRSRIVRTEDEAIT